MTSKESKPKRRPTDLKIQPLNVGNLAAQNNSFTKSANFKLDDFTKVTSQGIVVDSSMNTKLASSTEPTQNTSNFSTNSNAPLRFQLATKKRLNFPPSSTSSFTSFQDVSSPNSSSTTSSATSGSSSVITPFSNPFLSQPIPISSTTFVPSTSPSSDIYSSIGSSNNSLPLNSAPTSASTNPSTTNSNNLTVPITINNSQQGRRSPKYKDKAPNVGPNFLKVTSLASDISMLEDQAASPDTPTDFPSPDDRVKESEMELQALQATGESILEPTKKIVLTNLQNPVPLGSGASATVSKVTDVTDNRVYALKRVALQYEEKKDKIIPREVNTLFRCNHENVIKLYDAFLKDATIYIVLEYCECGSLQDICRVVKTIPEPMVSKIAKQVLLGLQYLHETMKIIHRDIKPANILCTKDGIIKLADFGMAANKGERQVFETFVGSEKYMSPERLKGGAHSFDSDLWSVALSLAEVNLGEFPLNDVQLFQFYNHSNVTEATVTIEKEMHFATDASAEFRDFCLGCLRFNPSERPTIPQLLQHPFIRKYDFKHSNEVSLSLRRWLHYNVLKRTSKK